MRMLSESSGIFPEPPIMSALLFSIPIIPIHNLGPVHPQAQLGLGLASDTHASILLAVHLTRPRIGTLENLPYRSRTCLDVPSVTPTHALDPEPRGLIPCSLCLNLLQNTTPFEKLHIHLTKSPRISRIHLTSPHHAHTYTFSPHSSLSTTQKLPGHTLIHTKN